MMTSADIVFTKLAFMEVEDAKKKSQDTAIGLGIGAIAGAISTAAVQPISQVTNMRSSFPQDPRFKTYLEATKNVYRGNVDPKHILTAAEYQKGFKGLKNFYKGLAGKLVQTAPQSALLLGVNALLYKLYKDKQREQNHVATNA
jgi:hypothetical protein